MSLKPCGRERLLRPDEEQRFVNILKFYTERNIPFTNDEIRLDIGRSLARDPRRAKFEDGKMPSKISIQNFLLLWFFFWQNFQEKIVEIFKKFFLEIFPDRKMKYRFLNICKFFQQDCSPMYLQWGSNLAEKNCRYFQNDISFSGWEKFPKKNCKKFPTFFFF